MGAGGLRGSSFRGVFLEVLLMLQQRALHTGKHSADSVSLKQSTGSERSGKGTREELEGRKWGWV